MTPHLTDTEINAICDGLTQPAAMIRYLREAGFTVLVKPNGRPLISREHFHTIMAGNCPPHPAKAAAQPNISGLVLHFQKRARA